MKNWSGVEKWTPAEVLYPTSEAAIQQIVKNALDRKKKIRIIGSGHSFTQLCVTDDVLISLDHFQGLTAVDQQSCQATVKGGTRLKHLGELLYSQGLGMENLGDIDTQSIAGTISTGTHGTGISLGTISTQVKAIRFVNGLGEIVNCSETELPSLFKAAQVSLGVLGIITEVTLQCVPAYKLKMVYEKGVLNDLLLNYQAINRDTRNFECFWLPYTKYVLRKSASITQEPIDKIGLGSILQEYILENMAFKVLCEMAYYFPSKNKWVSEIAASTLGHHVKRAYSHHIYATIRAVKFNEMEYSVPYEAYPEVMKAVQKSFDKHQFKVHFPIENRFVKGDDIYLSPAYGRDSAYIACHVYYKKPFKEYFKILEDIFKAYDGRPHWGKLHTLTAHELNERYPKMGLFLEHQANQDPENLFVSPYLNSLLFPFQT
ncbi:MAG: D-arabinono-1,4-lactone oxidase [Saprospiraceae bacterium]